MSEFEREYLEQYKRRTRALERQEHQMELFNERFSILIAALLSGKTMGHYEDLPVYQQSDVREDLSANMRAIQEVEKRFNEPD